MSNVSASFSAAGVGASLYVPDGSSFRYSVTGTFSGEWSIQRSQSLQSWENVLRGSSTATGELENETRSDYYYRFQCLSRSSGTIVTSISSVNGVSLSKLPLPGSVFRGAVASTTDSGIVSNDGKNWISEGVVIPSAVSPSFSNEENLYAIQSSIEAAYAAGGGIVSIGAFSTPIPISSSITMRPGVLVKGSGWIRDATTRRGSSGTVLQGDGTFPCFIYQATDSAVNYATYNAYLAACCTGGGVRDLAMDYFTIGIKTGAKYQGGHNSGIFDNLFFSYMRDWCYWFENCQYSYMTNLTCGTQQSSLIGAQMYRASLDTVGFPGNNTIDKLFEEDGNAPLTRRHLCFHAVGAGSILNFNPLFSAQVNGSQVARVVQAATMTNASANIGVTDSTKFPVDMPVTVSASANGFVINQTYFVVTSAANVVTLANYMGGTAINATGNTAVNLINYGFPLSECVGYGESTSGNVVAAALMSGLDMEQMGINVLLQNGQGSINFSRGTTGQDTYNPAQIVCRNWNNGTITSAYPLTFDYNSSTRLLSGGCQIDGTATIPFVQTNYTPGGVLYDPVSITPVISMGGRAPSGTRYNGLIPVGMSGGTHVYPTTAISQRTSFSTSTALGLGSANAGSPSFTGTSNAIWTLPLLQGNVGTGPGTGNSLLGVEYEIDNATTTGGVTLTLNVNGGTDNFGRGTAKTSYLLAQNTSIKVRAVWDGTTPYWKVVSNNGAV